MIDDIRAVLWKEWRELFQQRSTRGGLSNWVIMVLLIGVFMPWQTGTEWVNSPIPLLIWSWPPLLGVIWIVADSFAGERERHTLETLLASRLPDRAILLGKLILAVFYAWSMEWAALILGLVTVNLTHRESGLLVYHLDWAAAVLGISLGAILLISTIGCLVSLRSTTVRAAYQKVSLSIFAVAILPNLVLSLLPPDARSSILGQVSFSPTVEMAFLLIGVLIVLDAGLILFTLSRFQRSRLILD